MRIVWAGWAPAQSNIRLWRPHVSVWVHSRHQTSRRGRTPPASYVHEEIGDGDRAGDGVLMHWPIGPIPYTAHAGRRPAHPAAPLIGADGGNGARATVRAWPFPPKKMREEAGFLPHLLFTRSSSPSTLVTPTPSSLGSLASDSYSAPPARQRPYPDCQQQQPEWRVPVRPSGDR